MTDLQITGGDADYIVRARELENGGWVVDFQWECDRGDECDICVGAQLHCVQRAYSGQSQAAKDILQFFTDSGDWGDGDDVAAAKLLTR